VEYQPAWLTFEIQQALARLPTVRHRVTVLRLAEAKLVGRSEAETFKLPGVCSRRTWYGRYRNGEKKPGWRDDAVVQAALQAASSRALWWGDNAIARDIQRAQSKLAEASPAAVGVLITLMGSAENEETKRKSANDILDRASVDTAPKGREAYTIEMTWGDQDDDKGSPASTA